MSNDKIVSNAALAAVGKLASTESKRDLIARERSAAPSAATLTNQIAVVLQQSAHANLSGSTSALLAQRIVQDCLSNILNQHDKLMAALKSVIQGHCPNDKFFCGTCSPARELLAAIERE